MQREHIAYAGIQDYGIYAVGGDEYRRANSLGITLFQFAPVPGDHFSSFEPALERFFTEIERRSE